jgi:hypothetical protein
MIVYRPSIYISSDGMRSIINETNLYMTNTLKNDTDAFIIIKGSTFTNLNAYTSVKSLSVLGSIYYLDYPGILDYIELPYFENKGIVLNLKDFGGRVELDDSTFQRNFHYIPSILYTGKSKGDLVINNFLDSAY